ncbi:phosphotransferase [Streptomyces sp. TR02-1]|uniref:phosphotransferase n=1 Tax=Streptomyces sp. TR02-1 TaxID=3385977 RepID=UPI0039A10F2C
MTILSDFSGGWDSEARLVDGRWVERRPRRPEVERQLCMETRLMPWLAPQLPLPVPVPHRLPGASLAVRHVLVPGGPVARPRARHGHGLGRFLRALHAVSPTGAVRHGAPSDREAARVRATTADDFLARVVPLLPVELRAPGRALVEESTSCPAGRLVHGDLGPEHMLADGGVLSGVIDFGDAHIGDPAIDLAWALHGTPRAFAAALAAEYGVTPELRARSLLRHRLGPWHEVTHGLNTEDPATVRSGVAGVCHRLAAGTA